MNSKKIIIFSDFDGTFAEKDIGYRIYKHFSENKNDDIVRDWKAGLISSRECLTREAELLNVTKEEYYQYIEQFDLRDGAVEFYNHVAQAGIEFYILSYGTDLYIKYILSKNNLSEIKFLANAGSINGSKLTLEFPYDNKRCSRCGSCKGERIEEIVGDRKPEFNIVFIGDGLSDICAVPASDIVFARGDLLKYCRDNNYSVFEYNNFFDILNQLRKTGHLLESI